MIINDFSLQTILDVFTLIFLSMIFAYSKRRAFNMATKNDIGVITQKIEESKLEYSKQLEEYKHEMIKKYEFDKVLIEIKIDIFRSIVGIKSKLILLQNDIGERNKNLSAEMYKEMQNVMILAASITNLDPEIKLLNEEFEHEYNKFTNHLMEIKNQGEVKYSYDPKVFHDILDRLQIALIS